MKRILGFLRLVVAALGFSALMTGAAGAYTCGSDVCIGGYVYALVPGDGCTLVKTPKKC